MQRVVAIVVLVFFSNILKAENFQFYKGEDYYPIKYYLNESFDVTQNPYWFKQDNFFKRHKTVLQQTSHIKEGLDDTGGFSRFFHIEFTEGPILPNVMIHMIGGSYDLNALTEYYNSRGFTKKSSYWWAVGTQLAANLGNEAVETTSPKNAANSFHDHAADLLFFDVIPKVFGDTEFVKDILLNKLQMTNWSGQPMVNLRNGDIRNMGMSYVYRPNIFGTQKIRPMIYAGMMQMAGLSFEYENSNQFSFGIGPNYYDPLEKKGIWGGGIFWEIENRLALSFLVNGTENFRYRANFYPSIFSFKNLEVGAMTALDQDNRPAFGLNINLPFGVFVY